VIRACVLAFVLTLAGAAHAQRADDIPVPDATEIQGWYEQYINREGWTLLGVDSAGVALGSPDGVTRLADGTYRATVRHEYYEPRVLGGHVVRSMLQTRIVDCGRGMNRIVAMTLYERSNMQGGSTSGENDAAVWDRPSENSLYQTALERICAAPSEGEPLN
jgi:hypothetical protein